MSTLSGIVSKGEKGKSKYQCLDINNLYRGESLEPSQQKSTVQRFKHGMQSLGRVPSARRPPANLPSLKSESSGSEPAVSLVPTGGAGWGNKSGDTQSPTTTQPNVSTNSNSVSSNTASHAQAVSVTPSNTVLTSQSATLTSVHEQPVATTTHTTIGDKSWSSIMAGEAGAHPPSFLAHQSPLFQQEFPKLSSGDGQSVQTGQKSGSDMQYGPGPSLRPQTEGSWIQGGGRSQTGGSSGSQSLAQGPLPHHSAGVDHAGGRNSLGPHPPPGVAMGPGGPGLGISANGPPMHAPPLHLPPGTSPPQFRTIPPPLVYRANFPGAFPPNFQAGIGHPRQRFPGGFLSEGRFVGRPVEGEEIITRPIIKEEELNHMDDIARDSSWARADVIDYNEKIVFSDTEESQQDEEGHTRRDEKREREREPRETSESEKDRSRNDRDRRSDERPDKRGSDSASRGWQSHAFTRYPTGLRPQHLATRDKENEEEMLKEKRRLQIELVAVVTERAMVRKEEEEKRHEETKRAAAKKLQMLDEKLGKGQNNEKKDREDSATTVVPLPNWLEKNRQGDSDRDRSRTSSEGVDEKARHDSSDFRSTAQVERQSFLRTERDGRSRLPCDDRRKRDYEEKDGKLQSSHRQDRSRLDDRDRNIRSGDGPQSYMRHYQNNVPPRFLKQQAERNQSAASSNSNYMRSSGSPQPSTQSTSSNSFDPHWSHSSSSFVSQSSTLQNSGSRLPPRRFNSESSESNVEKSRNDRENEDWDVHDKYKSNRERNYGKHNAPHFDADHARRFYERNERRELDTERNSEDNWERDSNRDSRDSVSREKDRERHAEERKSEMNYDEDKEWRRGKERKSEERDSAELEDDRDKDIVRKEDRRDDRRIERPQRPDSRDSRASRESRNSRDSVREEKHEIDQKAANNRGFSSSIIEPHFNDEKKKTSERKDDREKKEQRGQRHLPGPPITREKLEASERNDTKRSLTQLKRFSDGKRTIEEKEIWGNQGNKERKSNESWSEAAIENESHNATNVKLVTDEKNKLVASEKKDVAKIQTELTKQENQEKIVKNDVKEEKENKIEKQDEEKEKREKSAKRGGHGRAESNRARQSWTVPVFRSSHGNRGDRRRRESGRLSGRNRFSNRDWKQGSESDISGDEVSASTESGKEDKKTDGVRPSKSRSHFKKTEKDERNKVRKSEVGESKGSFQNLTAPRFDRKSEFLGNSREGFAPSGQPSRRGRGSVRMRGGLSRRMDGYGPPPSKTLFSHQEDKKNHSTEKGNEVMADEKGNAEDDKGKQKQLSGTNVNSVGVKSSIGRGKTSQMPPRMQKKSEMEQREASRMNKSNRGMRHHGNKQSIDQGDDAWETTSENSEEERKLEARGNRKNYQRRVSYGRGDGQGNAANSRSERSGGRSNSSGKKFSSRDGHANKNNDIGGANERNSSGRAHNTSSNCTKIDGNINKDDLKSNEGNSSILNSNLDKPKGGNEDKDFDEGRNKMKDIKESSKPERKSIHDRDKERRNRSSKDSAGQNQAINSLTPAGGPQPLMSQVVPAPPKNFERELPPRFTKQKHNHRIQKQQSAEVVDNNKINHSMNIFLMKDSGAAPPSVNAWEKPLRSASPTKATTMQMVGNTSEPLQSENSSQRSSPHIPRDAVDKALLDGSSPPVNTIIFENTNFKSTPNDVVLKNQFNSHMKPQRSEKGERKISEEPEDMLGFSAGKTDLTAPSTERDVKPSEPPMIYGKSEDNADMKLDFQFETELSQLTDDKSTKGMRDLARSIQQSTMSPSTADLNFKIASVKKVWESMHTVTEHAEDVNNVSTFSPNFSPDSTMDPSTYGKTGDGSVVVTDDGSEVVYNTVPQIQVNVNYTTSKTDVSSTTSNVCKVKPQQQTVLSSGHSPIGHSGQSPLSHGGPISPPPYSTAQAGQFNYQQTNIGGTAAQFGGMSAIPSPPTVLYNSSTQLPPTYQTFQIDGTQVLSSQAARSQFSQFPPYGLSQGIGQTSAFSQQSVYLHQTAPPTAAPDLYQSSLSQYRIQPAAGPFGQSQLNNNPNTVLISSTANSLMSATVKPSTQPIGAIGTKGATAFQQNPLPSQHSQLFIPYDTVQLGVNQSYLPNSQIVQRGAPVQPSASSFYSGSAGAQAGFYQTPGSTLTQQAPGAPQLHQATGYSLQGYNSQSSATAVGLQSFGSQIGAQQYRSAGSVPPTTYLKSAVTPHHPTTINLAQKSSTTSSQQDALDSVFSSAPQIPSPKPRPSKQISQQQQQQQSPTQQSNNKFGSYQSVTQASSQLQQSGVQQRVSQSNINLQTVRSSGGSPRYPNPIQRPVVYQHSTTRYKPQSRPASNVKPYFGSQDGNLKLEESNDLKTDDSGQMNCDSKITDSGAQGKTGSSEDDTPKD